MPSSNRSSVSREYTLEEEARAVRKVDFLVLPCIILMFLHLQFDRTNLGNAQTDNFSTDIGITLDQINTGQTLFTLGMVLLELPSNVIAKYYGVNRWIPTIMLLWGVITLSQAFVTGLSGFYATRFLLAAGEAGFIPGMAWYITRWYKNGELSLRFAIFWASNSIAGMVAGPLALGIMSGLSEKRGWHGWQWLFFIEGLMTIAVAIFAFLYLPSAPMDGARSWGVSLFTKQDIDIILHRTLQDDDSKATTKGTWVRWRDVADTFRDWRIYGHCASAFVSMIIITPINTYGPSLIRSLGYARYTANGMQAPGAAIALVFSISLAYSSDRFRERGVHIAIAMLLAFGGCFWLAMAPADVGRRVLYGGYLLTAGTMGTGQAINASWLSSKMDERRRPIALAAYVMSIQLAGFAGANVFKAADAPRYTRGLTICGACALSGAVIILVWKALYAWDAKRKAQGEIAVANTETEYRLDGREGDDLEQKV